MPETQLTGERLPGCHYITTQTLHYRVTPVARHSLVVLRGRPREQHQEAEAYLFQCSLLRYRAGNMMGTMVLALSLIKLTMYSLFQK